MFIQLGYVACVGMSFVFTIVIIQLQASKQVLHHYFDTWHLYFMTCLEYTISTGSNLHQGLLFTSVHPYSYAG